MLPSSSAMRARADRIPYRRQHSNDRTRPWQEVSQAERPEGSDAPHPCRGGRQLSDYGYNRPRFGCTNGPCWTPATSARRRRGAVEEVTLPDSNRRSYRREKTAVRIAQYADRVGKEQVIAGALTTRRTNTWLITAFGLLALVLAAVGVYGVIAYSVVQRTREIGIRMALGAQPSAVRRRVIQQALVRTGIGLMLGLPAAWAAGALLRGFLYSYSASPASVSSAFILVTLAFIAAGCAAAYVPARQASLIDPLKTLREE
jgi:hypothetical protein